MITLSQPEVEVVVVAAVLVLMIIVSWICAPGPEDDDVAQIMRDAIEEAKKNAKNYWRKNS